MRRKPLFAFCWFLAVITMATNAQQNSTPPDGANPGAPPPANAGRGGRGRGVSVKSPEVASDGRVTFRLYAPTAQSVSVRIAGNLPLTKDDRGVWSGTTAVLKPDIYTYAFVVDGASVPDPANLDRKTGINGSYESTVLVAPPDSSWAMREVPHGSVVHQFFHSAVIGDDRDFYVYTPPEYDPSGKTRYPVLYLLHGFGDDASAWNTIGRANTILDNLIADRKAKPMIVVTTLGYGVAKPGEHFGEIMGTADENLGKFRESLITEVIPLVDRDYPTIKGREGRALAGLSMGGAETFYIGFNHIDTFAYLAGFSNAMVMLPGGHPLGPGSGQVEHIDPEILEQAFPTLTAKDTAKLKLIYVSCGTDDTLIEVNRTFKTWLTNRRIAFTNVETPGAHTWSVWRDNLTQVAPMLFQAK